MPMRQPRRIFRRAPDRHTSVRRIAGLALAGITATALLGGVAVLALTHDVALRPAGIVLPTSIDAEPQQVAVVDGSTLRLQDTVIGLLGVAAPGRGACPAADGSSASTPASPDCGNAASATLAGLVRAHRVECRLDGQDSVGRPLGLCRADGVEINEAVVESGWARADKDAPELAAAEATARARRRGLWSAQP